MSLKAAFHFLLWLFSDLTPWMYRYFWFSSLRIFSASTLGYFPFVGTLCSFVVVVVVATATAAVAADIKS